VATDQATPDKRPKSADAASPGNAQGVPVPLEDAMEDTSEERPAVEGVHAAPQSAQEQHTDELPAAGDYKELGDRPRDRD
jgi:hypothetical protein